MLAVVVGLVEIIFSDIFAFINQKIFTLEQDGYILIDHCRRAARNQKFCFH